MSMHEADFVAIGNAYNSRISTKGHAVSGLSSPIEAAVAAGKLPEKVGIVRALSMGVEHMRVLAHSWCQP